MRIMKSTLQVQTVIAQPGAYQAPAVKSRGATSMGRSANAFGSYAYGSGRVPNNGLEGYGAGRVRNISGGYQRKRPTSFGNYSWGEGRLL